MPAQKTPKVTPPKPHLNRSQLTPAQRQYATVARAEAVAKLWQMLEHLKQAEDIAAWWREEHGSVDCACPLCSWMNEGRSDANVWSDEILLIELSANRLRDYLECNLPHLRYLPPGSVDGDAADQPTTVPAA